MNESHRKFVAELEPEVRKRLTERRNAPGFLRLFIIFGAITIFWTGVLSKIFAWPLLMFPLGLLIVFLFALEHETIHRTAFKTVWINDCVAIICGLLIMLPPYWFRHFHFSHHRFTQDAANDPELISPKPDSLLKYAIYISGWPYWNGMLGTILENSFSKNKDAFVPVSEKVKVQTEARLFFGFYMIVVFVSIFTSSAAAFWCWLLPAAIGQPILRAVLLAEHASCPFSNNMLVNSQTTLTSKPLSFIFWNMNYHAEHHAYPAVPFHRLPELHALLGPHLRKIEQGYWPFHVSYLSRTNGYGKRKY